MLKALKTQPRDRVAQSLGAMFETGANARRKHSMIRRFLLAAFCCVAMVAFCQTSSSQAQQPMGQSPAYGASWGGQASRNMDRFYHYPYVTYPQNYWGSQYYRSADSLYHRYPPEMRIPVYNKQWHNYYPSTRRYHWGHQFITDIF